MISLIGAAIAGLLMAVSFPPFGWGFLGVPALVILFLSIRSKSAIVRFLLGGVYGVLFGGVLLYWLYYVHPAAAILMALHFGLAHALMAWLVGDLSTIPRTVIRVPIVWTAVEYLRSIGPYGFCWGLVGHTAWEAAPVLQISEFSGGYGVSVLLVSVAASLSAVPLISRSRRRDLVWIGLPILLLSAMAVWGAFRITRFSDDGERAIRLALVQPNLAGNDKWEGEPIDILRSTLAVTRPALEMKPDLVVWPETAVPTTLSKGDPEARLIRETIDSSGMAFLIGCIRETSKPVKHPGRNTVVLWPPGAEDPAKLAYYEKMHLVPWGEYVPWEDYFPYIGRMVTEAGGGVISAGEKRTIIDYEGIRFAVPICFESTVPDLVRKFVRDGAEFVINVSNEAWFLESGAQDQHRISSVFRAVENRRTVARATNTGRTCVILANGLVASEIDLYKQGVLMAKVPIRSPLTFYSRHGDVFARADLALAFVMIVAGWVRSRRRRP